MMPPQTGAANADATTGGQIKRLPCDHIFHKSCLRSWFQRQQTCPTCRTSILRFNPAQGAHAPAQAAAQPAAAAAPAQAQPPAAAAQQPVNQQQPTTSRAAGAASADNASNAASNAANNGASSVPNLSFFTAMFPPPPPPSAASFLGGINPQQFPLPPFGNCHNIFFSVVKSSFDTYIMILKFLNQIIYSISSVKSVETFENFMIFTF